MDAYSRLRRSWAPLSSESVRQHGQIIGLAFPKFCVFVLVLLPVACGAQSVEYFRLPTIDMEPTIQKGEVVEVLVGVTLAESGDVVVFRSPLDPASRLLKRVVAVAGDIVRIEDKRLFVNDEVVSEPYAQFIDSQVYPANLTVLEQYRRRDQLESLEVPVGTVFVLGDNRDQSIDSRMFGPLQLEAIFGTVVAKE